MILKFLFLSLLPNFNFFPIHKQYAWQSFRRIENNLGVLRRFEFLPCKRIVYTTVMVVKSHFFACDDRVVCRGLAQPPAKHSDNVLLP